MTHIYQVFSVRELMESLQRIGARYGKNQVLHHANCLIYRSIEVYDFCFCSCGLLHDLNIIYHLAEVLYPKFFDDCWLQDRQQEYKPESAELKKEWEEAEKVLYETFGAPAVPDLVDLQGDYEIDKKSIIEVFGNNKSMLKRLGDKLVKDMLNRWKYEKYRK